MSIITKTGDSGISHWQGKKVSKSSSLLHAVGSLDELQSFLGLLKIKSKKYAIFIENIQKNIWLLSGELAYDQLWTEAETELKTLEIWTKTQEQTLATLTNFVVPGINERETLSHICRTISRRAERHLVELSTQTTIRPVLLQYSNRLSDSLFILARLLT